MEHSRSMLDERQQVHLRKNGLLSEEEFAFIAGDLIVAENPVTNARRIVGDTKILTEGTNKRVLQG